MPNSSESSTRQSVPPSPTTCHGCGVCCLHMGYPTFMMPTEPATLEQIKSDPNLSALADDPDQLQHLLDGHPGESYWHNLPENLKLELAQFLATYRKSGELDDACFWLDPETHLCQHHEYRPRVCRDFDMGSDECGEWRHFYRDLIQLDS